MPAPRRGEGGEERTGEGAAPGVRGDADASNVSPVVLLYDRFPRRAPGGRAGSVAVMPARTAPQAVQPISRSSRGPGSHGARAFHGGCLPGLRRDGTGCRPSLSGGAVARPRASSRAIAPRRARCPLHWLRPGRRRQAHSARSRPEPLRPEQPPPVTATWTSARRHRRAGSSRPAPVRSPP